MLTKGLPHTFFREVLLQLSLLLGYPVLLDGLEFLSTVNPTSNHPAPTVIKVAGHRRRGAALLRKIYGEQAGPLVRNLDRLHPGLARRVVMDAYGAILSRQGLSICERELINVVVLYLLAYERQLYSHVRGALRVGVMPETLHFLFKTYKGHSKMNFRRVHEVLERVLQGKKRTNQAEL